MNIALGRRPAARRTARPPDSEETYDAHAAALLALAGILLGDAGKAESVVVEVLRGAGRGRRAPDDRSERRNLARAVYAQCTRVRRGPGAPRDDGQVAPWDIPRRLAELTDQERAGIALSMYGAHTYTDTADLLALPAPVVAQLLRTGLARLAISGGPRSAR